VWTCCELVNLLHNIGFVLHLLNILSRSCCEFLAAYSFLYKKIHNHWNRRSLTSYREVVVCECMSADTRVMMGHLDPLAGPEHEP